MHVKDMFLKFYFTDEKTGLKDIAVEIFVKITIALKKGQDMNHSLRNSKTMTLKTITNVSIIQGMWL